MATIRKRGGKFQAIVRRGHHSQAKTFSKRADAEHWAKWKRHHSCINGVPSHTANCKPKLEYRKLYNTWSTVLSHTWLIPYSLIVLQRFRARISDYFNVYINVLG